LITYSAVRSDLLYKFLGLAVTLDVSDSGLRVRTNEPLPIGEELSFTLKVGDNVYRVLGRVIWGSEVEANKAYEFGVRFSSVDFGLAKDLWKLTEGALASAPKLEEDEQSSVDKLLATVTKALAEHSAPPLGDAERELLRRLLDGSAAHAEGPAGAHSPVLEATASQPREDSSSFDLVLSVTPVPGMKRWRMPTPKPQGGVVGNFEGDQLVEFVQMLGVQQKTGVLEVVCGYKGGHLAFREGIVIAARTHDNERGEAAAHRVLGLRKGHFDFWPHRLVGVTPEHGFSVSSLLLEAMRRRDSGESSDETPGFRPDEGSDPGAIDDSA
jgi:Tfp pilus assembly protein PilZ